MKKFLFIICVAGGLFALMKKVVPAKINPAEHVLAVARLAGGTVVRENFSTDAAPYLALYHGASWCGPCQAFSPSLSAFYHQAGKSHPSFQLVMVNYDHSDAEMIAYMRQHHMEYPAVMRDAAGGWARSTGNGIPNLIVVETATGKILSSSFEGSDYVGCEPPLAVLQRIAQAGHP